MENTYKTVLQGLDEQTLKERGFVVHNPVTCPLVYDEPLLSHTLIVGIVQSGSVTIEYDTQPITLGEKDIFVLMPRHTISIIENTEDYKSIMLEVSKEIYEHIKTVYPAGYQENLHYHWDSHFHLNDDQFECVHSMLKVLNSVCWSDSSRRSTLVHKLLEALLVLLHDYHVASGAVVRRPSPYEQLFAHFTEAVAEHYTESREVRYYANLFCLSPKHFAAIIKQQTGRTASDWITEYVIVQAKSMLWYNPHCSIQEVAYRMGFSDQATFARYFKTNTGVSPRTFREKRMEVHSKLTKDKTPQD